MYFPLLEIYPPVILALSVDSKTPVNKGFPCGSEVKNPPASAVDSRGMDSIPRSGISPGEGNANPLPYSCLGNPMDTAAWEATVRGVIKSQSQMSMHVAVNKIWNMPTHSGILFYSGEK